ncbi:MAG: tetratricopeptide repeat protein [Nitrospinae bacterium]|nr:tetratricopeptide repeat protein [Nitrospinota bacterium]
MVQIGQRWLLRGVILLVAVLLAWQGVLPGELSPEEHFKRGMEAARQQRFDEAVTEFQQALRLKPDDGETLARLAFVYIELNHFQEAQRTLKRLLTLNPRHVLGHLALGRIYFLGQAYALAAGEFQQTLTFDPEHQGARAVLDLLQANAHDDFERVESFEAANRQVQAYRNRKELSAAKGGIFHAYEFIVLDTAGIYLHSYAVTSHQMSPGAGATYYLDRLEPPRQQSLVKSYGEHKPLYPAVKEEVVNALKTSLP